VSRSTWPENEKGRPWPGVPALAGRPARFEYRNEERDDVRQMFAVATPQERRAVIDRIEAKGRGKPDRRAGAGRCAWAG